MASSTSSELSASTPSKNWPTSNFQRREVGAEHVDLVGVGQLVGDVVGAAPAEQQVEPAVVGAHVAHPLAVAPRRDEVLDAVEGEQVHRHPARLAGACGRAPRAPGCPTRSRLGG